MDEKQGEIEQIQNSIAKIDKLEPVEPELLKNENLWAPSSKVEVTVMYAKLLSADVPENHLEESVKNRFKSTNHHVENVRKIEDVTNYEALVEIHLAS